MKIKVSFKEGFRKTARVLNKKQRDKLADLIILLISDPYHPKLHTKSLLGRLSGVYVFRITREWRVLFKFISPTEIILLEVGNRKDIYK